MTRPAQLLALVITLLFALGAASADHKQYRYVGGHPIPKSMGGGFCHIMAPHVHIYAPMNVKVEYRDHDGWNYFVGDPVAYGWDGPKVAYYGHHPVPVDVIVGDDDHDTEYCYIEGPHYHYYSPPPGLSLELRGGAYWYTGDFPRAYVEARPVYDPIDTVYTPIVYDRPVVEVSLAPPHWYGAVVVAAPVVVAPPVVVAAPVVVGHVPPGHGGIPPGHMRGGIVAGVGVIVPAPSLSVTVGLPSVHIGVGGGVIVHDGRHGGPKEWKHGHGHGHGHH